VEGIQEVFNNREIAIGIWGGLAIAIFVFTKPGRDFIKNVIPILFCHRFVILYIVFLGYFGLVTYGLYAIGFWDISLLKDTIFWIFFVELPLFVKTIEKAKDNYFFSQLLKENIAIIVIIEFILNFWTFGLVIEIIIVPISLIFGLLYAISARDKKTQQAKRFFDWLLIAFGIVVFVNAVVHIIQTPKEIINLAALKQFVFPIILLVLNLPVVYGLALHNAYEQVFIRVKGNEVEKNKIKRKIFIFAGFYLSKITAVRNNATKTLVISLTESDMKSNLDKLEQKLSMNVGENYMKRTRFYLIWSIIGIFICFIILIQNNSNILLTEFLTFDFTFDLFRIKEIITYISSSGIVIFFCFFIYSLGLRQKKKEEISLIKKYALYNLFYLIKRQNSMLQEFPPIDAPKELFILYVTTAYELKIECDKSVVLFENLLTTWELDTIKQLQSSLATLIQNIGIDENEINQYNCDRFNSYYVDKKTNAPQNEEINVFIHDIQSGIEKFSEQIKLCFEEFKPYL